MHFVFFRRVALDTGRVVACAVARSPEPFTRPRAWFMDGVVAAVSFGARCLFVRLEPGREDVEIVRFGSYSEVAPAADLGDLGRDPTPRLFFWEHLRAPERPRHFLAHVPSGQVQTLAGSWVSARPGSGPDGRPVIVHRVKGDEVRALDPDAREVRRLGYALRLESHTRSPRGDGLIGLGAFRPNTVDSFQLAILEPDQLRPARQRALPFLASDTFHALATSRSCGLAFALTQRADGDPELLAFDETLVVHWTLRQACLRHLMTDARDEHVAVLLQTQGGPIPVVLGTSPPTVPEDAIPALHCESASPGLLFSGRASAGQRHAVMSEAVRPDSPELGALRGAIARSDRLLGEGERAARFAALADTPQVWRVRELQSLCRLADAAMAWEAGPWGQRLHAVAVFADAWTRNNQLGEAYVLDDVAEPWSGQQLVDVLARALKWLDAQSDGRMSLLRTGAAMPAWPPPGLD